MSMFGRLRNNVCAIALLMGIASSPLTASKESSEEPRDDEKALPSLQGEAQFKEDEDEEEWRLWYAQNEERFSGESESTWKVRRGIEAEVLQDVIDRKKLRRIVESLPDEVIAHILSFTGLDDWGDIRLVCSRFRDVSRFVFKDLENFKNDFDIIANALWKKRSENPDNLLEHYADALNTMRRQYAQLLNRRTHQEKLTLGRMIYSRSQHEKLSFYRSNQGKTPYEDALFSVWPPLAATMVILGGTHHFSYEKGSYKEGSYRIDYFIYDPAKIWNLGSDEDARGSGPVFALIGDAFNLQITLGSSKHIERQALFASELMHRGAEARRAIIEEAFRHLRKKDYDNAFTLLQLVVGRYPDAPEIEANDLGALALLYEAKSRQENNEPYKKSYKFYLKKAVEKDRENFRPDIYLSAAEFYVEEEQWDQAMENYKIAFAKNPGFGASVYKDAGETFINGKQFNEALHYLIEAKSLDPQLTPEVDAYLGLANLKLDREDKAREYAEKALKAGAFQKISSEDLDKFIELFKLVEGYEAYLAPLGQ